MVFFSLYDFYGFLKDLNTCIHTNISNRVQLAIKTNTQLTLLNRMNFSNNFHRLFFLRFTIIFFIMDFWGSFSKHTYTHTPMSMPMSASAFPWWLPSRLFLSYFFQIYLCLRFFSMFSVASSWTFSPYNWWLSGWESLKLIPRLPRLFLDTRQEKFRAGSCALSHFYVHKCLYFFYTQVGTLFGNFGCASC